MKAKNLVALVFITVFAFALASADQKAKKATAVKKDTKGCCMDTKLTKASDDKSATHATNAKHEHGKGMDCSADGKECKEEMTGTSSKESTSATHATNAKHEKGKGMDCEMDKDGKMSSKDGKDCCKEMTKAENTKSETKSEAPAPKD